MRAAMVAVAALVHIGLLLAPVIVLGGSLSVFTDPALALFLVLATALLLADVPAIGRDEDDRETQGLALLAGLLMLATFTIALGERAWRRDTHVGVSSVAGALVMLTGVGLRVAAVRTLGPQFVTAPRIGPLVETGTYAWLRHPSEAGNLAVTLGACLLLGGRWAVLPWVGLLVTVRSCVWKEDVYLDRWHGRRHARYKARVGGLFPKWSCRGRQGLHAIEVDVAQPIATHTRGATHREPVRPDSLAEGGDRLGVEPSRQRQELA